MAQRQSYGARRSASHRRPFLVSFSGIDGAGKTTQIEALLAWLSQAGLRVRVLRFWDDVAVLSPLREAMGHALFKGEKGVGSPQKPVARRDKNVQTWYMTAVRFLLYLGDAVRLAVRVARTSTQDVDVIIFDRYLYDELANLDLSKPISRAYAGWLLRLVPRPDCPLLLDADPTEARARKPEYPVEFLHRNRAAYLALSDLAGGLTVIAVSAVEDVTRSMLRSVEAALRTFLFRRQVPKSRSLAEMPHQ